MTRIAYLSVSDQLGGSEVALLEMIRAVRRSRPRWQIDVVLPGTGPLFERALAAGARCRIVPLPRSVALLGESGVLGNRRRLRAGAALGMRLVRAAVATPSYERRLGRALAACDPDIVHSNGLKTHVLSARTARHAALVWHLHEYISSRPVTRWLLRRQARRCDAILANSASVATDAQAVLAAPVPVRVIHNAVDLEMFSPDTHGCALDDRVELPPPSSAVIRVGLIATFARWKGHDTFLQALAMLPARLPVRGYVIGAPLYTASASQYSLRELRAMASALGLDGRVGFPGFLPPGAAMRALDVVVHASTQPEPFGLVIAEAMACGRAVITSGAGGAAELIDAEHDALVHPPGDAAALARCITRLADDATLRRRLEANARVTAERRFDPRRLAAELVGVYEALTDRRRHCA